MMLNNLHEITETSGRQAVLYHDKYHPTRPLVLHTYKPEGVGMDAPVVIVQHGVLRNGDEYRDFWIPVAQKHGLLIVAVTFSNQDWPGVEFYNNGAMLSGDLQEPLKTSSYGVLERVVDALCEARVTSQSRVYLFGHSAGGQFVHRLMSTQAHHRFKAVAAGNPGWYTLPDLSLPFPEGLNLLGVTPEHLVRLLTYPLTILAGDQDIQTDDPHLPSNPEAIRQGPHRYARAHNYYEQGKKAAAQLGVTCAWKLQTVPGIGHDGKAMSEVMGSLWFDGCMPSDEYLRQLAGVHVA